MQRSLPFTDPSGFNSALLKAWFSIEDECVSVWDSEDLGLVYMNPSGCQIFGYEQLEEMLQAHRFFCFDCVAGEASFRDTLNTVLLEKGQWEGELQCRRKDGRPFPALVTIVPFSYEGRNYLLKRVINIEDRKQMEGSLIRQTQRFEALFQYASLAIMVANQEGAIILANRHAMRLFGYVEQSLVGTKVEDLIPMRYRDKHVQYRQKYTNHPQNRPMGTGIDLFARRKDGTEFPVEISLGHYQNEEGRFVIAFVIDITHRKEIEQAMRQQQMEMEKVNREIESLNDALELKVEQRTRQLQDTLAELERSRDELEQALSKEKELSDLKTRFVSMASHEFRTPLSTILSSASLVAKYTQTEEQNKRDKHIQRIRSAVSNLTDILNEFLSIGRIEEGRIQVNFSEFNIREQVMLVSNEMQTILRPGQHIHYQHEGNETVKLDLSLLRNIFINLLSNASKFSSDNAVIDVTSVVAEREIRIVVSDHGIGISDEDKKHLFERFFRGKNVTNIQGTGLGLHIVAKYVELMNGEIVADSQLEKGTTIIIRFAV